MLAVNGIGSGVEAREVIDERNWGAASRLCWCPCNDGLVEVDNGLCLVRAELGSVERE